MPKLWIDNQPIEVEPDATVLEAARQMGIDIPALCYLEGVGRPTSCLVCLVKVNGKSQLVPSCATKVEDGMQVESETVEVHEARRTAMELLLSDHLGDCMSPCHRICPLDMNIPQMIRQINAGNMTDAILTVKSEIPFPSILGRVCHKPCEGGCRRVLHDEPVAVAMLERHVGDSLLASEAPYLPQCEEPTGRKVAIVGAGPTGLSAAYSLLQRGHECHLFDEREQAGGSLRYAMSEEELPKDVLDAEVELLAKLGAQFRMETKVCVDISLEEIQKKHDAVLIATGKPREGSSLDLETSSHGLKVDSTTHETSLKGVFAAGEAVR
ncbi:MAG: (2Fe-2S)-binding protein, partial [Armatimonadetes bacterium]|nr:(2Fe-2S)-binding protein [Armatimonadota bacterium]